MNDKEKEGKWRWGDETDLSYQYWADGEPNNHLGVEDCGLILGREDRHWADSMCFYLYRFICKREVAIKSVSLTLPPYAQLTN